MTLTEFLTQRLAEDEALSLDAGRYGKDAAPHRLSCGLNDINVLPCDCGYPDRLLAQVEAHRAVLTAHQGWHVCPNADGAGYTDHGDGSGDEWEPVCPTVRHLAAVYSDHADYDPSWAVS